MNSAKRILPFSTLLLLAFAGNTQGYKIDSTGFFSKANFLNDTLYIKTTFSECGEFGGHTEISKIYFKDGYFYIDYQKFQADCNNIGENYGEPSQTLVEAITKIISEDGLLFTRFFCHDLADSKPDEQDFWPRGCVLQIIKKSNNINLHVYKPYPELLTEYLELVKKLTE